MEADFLSSHAPYTVGGLHGAYPDGSGWVFLMQKAPVAAHELVGAADPWWPMIDDAHALDQNPDASTRAHVAWTREGLLQACVEQGRLVEHDRRLADVPAAVGAARGVLLGEDAGHRPGVAGWLRVTGRGA